MYWEYSSMASDTRWRALHLFVSSTFNDMHAERDHLRHVVFPELEERLRARRVHLQVVDLRWGVDTLPLDQEAEREREVLRYCLDEVERCRPFLLVLMGDRYGYIPDREQLPEVVRRLGREVGGYEGMSVTELEIEAGLLADTRLPLRHRVFMRHALDECDLPPDRLAAMSDRAAGRLAAADALARLKQRLTVVSPERCADYRLQWDAGSGAFGGLESFGEAVCEALWADFDAATAAQVERTTTPPTPLTKHQAETAELIELRQPRFVGRSGMLERLERFCLGGTPPPALLLTAPPGTGKTSLVAALAARLAADSENPPLVLAHFVGNSAEAANLDAMLRVFGDLLADACGESRLEEVADHERLREGFAYLLSRAAAHRRVVLLLDGLDRLEPTPEARGMGWLPLHWPTNARVVASAVEGAEARTFAARMSIDATVLPPLEVDEARALVRHLCALEHRKPSDAVVDAILGVAGREGERASLTPLWLTIAVGQLNRVQGADFLLAGARFERLADAQLAGYLADWVARLPGDVQNLFASVLRAAEGHFGADARHLARVLALARHGWRESDLLGILSQITQRRWPPLALVKLRHALHGALAAGQEGLWRFAHDSLSVAVIEDTHRSGQGKALHAAVVSHLLALPEDDPIRCRELAYHALRADQMLEAGRTLAGAAAAEDEHIAIDTLIAELRIPPAEGEAGFDWLRKLLWAGGLRGGERLRLAERLQAAAERLAREHRWRSCRAALYLLPEFYGASAGGLLERRDAEFRQAQVAAELGACARALGEHKAAVEQLVESGRLAMTLLASAGRPAPKDSVAALHRAGTGEAQPFHQQPTLDRMAQWCDLAVHCPCAIAEVLMEMEQIRDANFIVSTAMTIPDRYPPPLRQALEREQPLRVKATVALTSAFSGLFMLFYGSGNGAIGHFHNAHGRLATILSFIPRSLALRREIAILEARTAQALHLADAPGTSVRSAMSAVGRLHDLCRERPAVSTYRLDRAFALRCLADGWEALGEPLLAGRARASAARDILSAVDEDADGDAARRTLAWAKQQQPAGDGDLSDLLGCPLPEGDYQTPKIWSSNDAEKESEARDPGTLALWRREVLDGPRFGNWLPAVRIAHFALSRAILAHGNDALTEETMSITTPQGVEHHLRDLKAGIAKAFHIDGEATLAALTEAADAGAPEAQTELGLLFLDGVFGAEFEREGQRWLRAAARAGSDQAALRLGEHLLSAPDDPEAWRQGAQYLIKPADAGDPRALATLAYVILHGRGTPKDPARAMELLRAAAEGGHLSAAFDLGVYCQTGEMVPEDHNAARIWYEKAAAGGFVPALTNLGAMLLSRGEDTTRAIHLLEQSCQAGETLAMVSLAGHLVHADPTPEHLGRARGLLELAHRAGRAEAGFGLGFLMASGLGGERDLDSGLKLMKQAVDRGDLRAHLVLQFLHTATECWPVPEQILGLLRNTRGWTDFEVETLLQTAAAYREREAQKAAEPADPDGPQALFERGVYLSQRAKPPDFKGAYDCYARAAQMGHPEAAYNLAYLYLSGEGVERDPQTGLDWMRRAAESGNPQMQYELGVLLSEGAITTPNREEALHWYRRAADQGFPPALHNLAWCYLQGTGVERDPEAALAHFRKAAAAGLPQSAGMVARLESGA